MSLCPQQHTPKHIPLARALELRAKRSQEAINIEMLQAAGYQVLPGDPYTVVDEKPIPSIYVRSAHPADLLEYVAVYRPIPSRRQGE